MCDPLEILLVELAFNENFPLSKLCLLESLGIRNKLSQETQLLIGLQLIQDFSLHKTGNQLLISLNLHFQIKSKHISCKLIQNSIKEYMAFLERYHNSSKHTPHSVNTALFKLQLVPDLSSYLLLMVCHFSIYFLSIKLT